MLDENIANQTSVRIKDKVTVLNSVPCFSFSQYFRLKRLYKKSLSVIERWFTTIADSKNFLELDFPLVAAILSSSELLIDSELQVSNVMNAWLNHNSIERSKHAKYLLQRVRLSLLTLPALKSILDKNLSAFMNDDCSEVIKKVIRYKTEFPLKRNNTLPASRYCSQDNFKIITAGGSGGKKFATKGAYAVGCADFARFEDLPTMNHARNCSTVICIRGEIYLFGGFGKKLNRSLPIEKWSPAANRWEVIAKMHDTRRFFCACSFVDKVYCVGGSDRHDNRSKSCVVFDTKNQTWNKVARMKQRRSNASCAVFEGRIVVTGGSNRDNGVLNTVEAYDHIDDSWSKMPNMVESSQDHKSVAIKNKLYVVTGFGDTDSEVFDSNSNTFVLLKRSRNFLKYKISGVTTIGNMLALFIGVDGAVIVYDVENDVLSEKHCEATERLYWFSCAKLPLP